VWGRLRKQIAVERAQLTMLLETHRSITGRCRTATPSAVECSAMAAVLHSFYTGIENIFRRVAIELDGGPPGGDAWHRGLLEAMVRPTDTRPAVISQEMRDRLHPYLQFRHFFRHAYAFQLRWERMAPLVHDTEDVLRSLESQLDAFSDFLSSEDAGPS